MCDRESRNVLANIRYTGYIKISTFIMARVERILCVHDVNRESVSTCALSADDHTPEIITCQVNLIRTQTFVGSANELSW